MDIDPRLNEIDDCLYRVAARILALSEGRVLLIKEIGDDWWALPGGGIDHGESIELAITREVEELGVPASKVSSDFEIVYYNIGNVVNTVPRMNLFFKVSIPEESVKKTNHIAEWRWFTKEEFLDQEIHASFDKNKLVDVIFSDSN